MTRRLLNEEEVKVKYLLPVLRGLGFDEAADLRFEYAIPGAISGQRHTTFADVVVIRGERPVLVIEVKAADLDVHDQRAIDQAVGYARANRTVIPYALITNGRDCLLVDTLAAQPIAVGRELFNTEVDFLLRSEMLLKKQALRLMGAVAPADFVSWANDQRERALGSMSGVGASSSLIVDKKYLAALYAPRHRLDAAFDRFLLSPKRVFALVGDAGLGKTTFLCNLSSRLGMNQPVLFYHGAEISSTWEDLLLADVGTALSVKSLSDALPRMARLAPVGGEVFVFIDALNECSGDRDALRAELNSCARLIEHLPVRFVVSCRTLDWDFWTRNERRMTGEFGRAVYSDSVAANDPAVSITRFDDGEFVQAWHLYERGFNLVGTLGERMVDLCREPFMLRLVAEVYRDGAPIPDFVEPLSLFERYWREKFPSQAGELKAGQFLDWMAQRILDSNEARVRTADIPSDALDTCLELLDESVLIRRLASHLYFRFELFLEFVVANHLMATLPDEAEDAQRESLVSSLTASTLVNMPGIVENILLTWKHRRPFLYGCLRHLASLDDRWKAICCSVLRKLGERLGENAPVVDLLATSTNHVVRAFLAESLSRTDSAADVARLAMREDSWESRETAAIAFGRMGRFDVDTKAALGALSDDFHWRVRRAAGYALKELWESGIPGSQEWKQQLLLEASGSSWRQKYTLCSALVGTRLDETSLDSTVIDSLADDGNCQVRWGVANYVLRCVDPWRRPALERLLGDPDPWVRSRLGNSLVAASPASAGQYEEPLLQLVDDPAAMVRVKLARELTALSDTALARRILRGYLQDADEDVEFAARYSLSALGEMDLAGVAKDSDEGMKTRILRERVARRDVDPVGAVFMPTYEYIARRTELRAHAESHMWVIDAMCSLILDSVSAAREDVSAIEGLLSLLCRDKDEAVRWALVAFLVRFGGDQLPLDTRLSTFRTLAQDDHWWVRREVAMALGESNDLSPTAEAAVLLAAITAREKATPQDCSDEVLYFAERSARHIGEPV